MTTTTQTTETYVRFDLSQRIQHICLIASFTLLAVTGLPQLFVQARWAQGFMSILGGIDGVRRIHHLAATLLIFVFVFHFFNVFFDLLARKGTRMVPNLQDGKDAVQAFSYLLGRTSEKPQYDKFDFRQKLEYWALIWGTFLMGLTGLILMFPEFFASFHARRGHLRRQGRPRPGSAAGHRFDHLVAHVQHPLRRRHRTDRHDHLHRQDQPGTPGREEHPLEYQRLIEQEAGTDVDANKPAEESAS